MERVFKFRKAIRFPKLADPDPEVIQLFRRIDDRGDVSRDDLVYVKAVLKAWRAREDLPELRGLLGVRARRGRRRKQLTVDREGRIAVHYGLLRQQGAVDPAGETAERFNCELRSVERAWTAHKDLVEAMLSAVARCGVPVRVERERPTKKR